jgi:hypothetical protein
LALFQAHASAPQAVFSPEQEVVSENPADYLISHPEILGLSQKLLEQQEVS